jgi:hypothetical protein
MRMEISLLEELSREDPSTVKSHSPTITTTKHDNEVLCLLCTIKTFLLQNSFTQLQFDLEGGYDFLYSWLALLITHTMMNKESLSSLPPRLWSWPPCTECTLSSSSFSNFETDSGKLIFETDFQTNLIFFFLSLLFDHDLTPTHFMTVFDNSVTQAFHGRLHLKNRKILQLLLKFVEHKVDHRHHQQQQYQEKGLEGNMEEEEEDLNVSLFGLSILEIILRLNPLSLVAIEAEGGIFTLQKLLIHFLFFQSFSLSATAAEESSNPLIISHRGDRSRSSSSGTSSTSLPTTTTTTTDHTPLNSSSTQSPPSDEHNENNLLMLQKNLLVTTEILQLLVRIAVIFSERNSSVLIFLVIIVQQLSQRLNLTSKSSWIPQEKCSNCEAEIAEFECTHHR